MDKKIISKAKAMVGDNIAIIKQTPKKIFFKVNSFEGSYNINMKTQAPQWFKEFEKRNDARWDNQEKFNGEMLEFKTNQEKFNGEMLEFKTNQEKFNEQTTKSLKKIDDRITNLVVKNNLTE